MGNIPVNNYVYKASSLKKQSRSVTVSFRVTPDQKEMLVKAAHSSHRELNSFLYEIVGKYMQRGELEEKEKPRLREFAQVLSDQILTRVIEKLDAYERKNYEQNERINESTKKVALVLNLMAEKIRRLPC